jgi:predicted deacylase
LLAVAAATAFVPVLVPVGSNAASSGTAVSAAAPAAALARPAVVSVRVIGHSVKGRPIRAFELGDPGAAVTGVLVGRQHGNEPAGETVLRAMRDGAPITGVHLWVIPRANPDGAVKRTRQNARGVDLNRNWPRGWKRVTGYYNSGRRPASEPETRGLQRFLNTIRPDYVVNIHTPLRGLDVTGAKDRAFARRLSKELNLPNHHLTCRDCHGTMSDWFNWRHAGACVTIEFGANPSLRRLTVAAPRGLLRALGGRYL